MNSYTTLLQTILENAFLYTITPNLSIITAACGNIFGKGIEAIITEQNENGFTMEITAKGSTTAVHFKTEQSTNTNGSIRIIGIEL